MSKLEILQNSFIDGIYLKEKSELISKIKDGKAPKSELFDIYRNNLYASLTNALEITYPKIYLHIGDKKFTNFCHEFIKNNRSKSGNLDDYGADFANFLNQKNEDFFADLARLEWLQHQSYLQKDVKAIDLEELQKFPAEKLFDIKFKINPSCFLFSSKYNLLAKKKQYQPLKRRANFLIYRYGFEVKSVRIFKDDFYFLKGIKEDLSLYQIHEKYRTNVHDPLQKYLTNYVLSDFIEPSICSLESGK